jgi:lipopolysaccharide/colanic/teichoic acid biosynthesis glycosyltransferase
MFYVQHWSFWMDLIILAKTVRVVFRGEGAK